MRDEDVRTACMAHLSVLEAEWGVEVPYVGALAKGFPFRGGRAPFLNRQKGIHQVPLNRPKRALDWPDPTRLEARFAGFLERAI